MSGYNERTIVRPGLAFFFDTLGKTTGGTVEGTVSVAVYGKHMIIFSLLFLSLHFYQLVLIQYTLQKSQ